MSIQRGELKVLIDLLERDPAGVNACDEVSDSAEALGFASVSSSCF